MRKGAAILLLLLAAGCDLPGKPNRATRPAPADEVHDFGVLFQRHCSGCHGADGTLGPAPPLNDPLFLAIVPENELLRIVRDGRPGTLMPAFLREQGGPLTAAQVTLVAEGLKKRWGTETKRKVAAPPYKSEAAGDAQRGATAFARACAVCHGGDGDDPKNKIHDPVFLALLSDQVLRRLVITGRPDLGMPDFAGARPDSEDFKPLSGQEVSDIGALLASWRRRYSSSQR
jgi:mono/diheme cytochrome c family protein